MSLWKLWELCALSQIWKEGGWWEETQLGRHDISWLARQSWEIQSIAIFGLEVFCEFSVNINYRNRVSHVTVVRKNEIHKRVKVVGIKLRNTTSWIKLPTLTSPVVSDSEGHLTEDIIYCHVRWHLM